MNFSNPLHANLAAIHAEAAQQTEKMKDIEKTIFLAATRGGKYSIEIKQKTYGDEEYPSLKGQTVYTHYEQTSGRPSGSGGSTNKAYTLCTVASLIHNSKVMDKHNYIISQDDENLAQYLEGLPEVGLFPRERIYAQLYRIKLSFHDANSPEKISPPIVQLNQAQAEIATCAKHYAGLKLITIQHPDGTKDVYNGAGEYQMTIPPIPPAKQ